MKRDKSLLNTEQIVVRVTPTLKAVIEEHCAEQGMSIAEWVRCCGQRLVEAKQAREKKQKP